MNRNWIRNLDWTVIGTWAALVVVGLVAIYSATHGPASEFLLDTVQRNFARQAQMFVIASVAFAIILLIPATTIRRLAYVGYAFTLVLLLLTLAFGREINGAKSWLYIGPVGLQTSEFMKVGIVVAVARLLSTKEARTGQWQYVAGAIALIAVPMALIALSDAGTALVVAALIPILLFWTGLVPLPVMALLAGIAVAAYLAIVSPIWGVVFGLVFTVAVGLWVRQRWFTIIAGVCSVGVALVTRFALYSVLKPHQRGRLTAFVEPEAYRLTEGYHMIQAKAAVGSGGLFGKGFMSGTQTQLAFIPEQSTDFIFSVIGEEFGFLGAMLVLGLFALLLVRLTWLGTYTGYSMTRLVAGGATGLFLVHTLINIGMNLGVMPVIGIPLPFVSYGRSALLANTILVAVALNLHARREEFSIYGA
ncbi:MAG: FtsW/RodA/SpoVE family cell cycle protein [Bacteroidota bacterium]